MKPPVQEWRCQLRFGAPGALRFRLTAFAGGMIVLVLLHQWIRFARGECEHIFME